MATSYSPKIITDNLLLAYDVANTKSYVSGSPLFVDMTNRLYSGSLVSVGYGADTGSYISFDGTTSYVDTPFPTELSAFPALDFSVTCWLNIRTMPGSGTVYQRIFDICRSIAPDNCFQLASSGDANTMQFYGRKNDSQFGRRMQIGATPLNRWIHVACTWRDATNTPALYVDGVAQTNSQGGNATATGTNVFNIGKRANSGVGSFYDGKMSLFMMYTKTLSQTEVLQNYEATRGRFGV